MARTAAPPPPPPTDDVRDEPLARALGDRYLAYALSTITSRALPDVRDGLKPVHRRILFAMSRLGLNPTSPFKKSATVVGEVIGKYHPHGDQSIYDAMVRLAQDFAARYPIVDGQGNFGSIDGDNPAAYRYTESRLTAVATSMVEGLDEDAVDFRDTYNQEGEEPTVMPGAFPNLLANGAAGIAVGMATSIPPHNAGEICDALVHLIKTPAARDDTLLNFIKGPDFPTGGIIVETREAMAEAYRTGRGGFRTRAAWHKEEGSRGSYIIVVDQIPYQVQKSKLIERVAALLQDKKLPLLEDIRDESAEDIRLVLEPKSRTVDPELLMEQLFRQTELESRFPLNLNVIDAEGAPRVMSLKEALQAFLDHRRVVLRRRSEHRLEQIARRMEVLEGYLVAFLNLDKVIKIIREEDEPKPALMRAFKINEVQTDAILNMRLRSLRKLEEMEIRTEHKGLKDEAAGLKKLLGSDDLQWKRIGEEIAEIKAKFGPKTPLGARRTQFADAPALDEMPEEHFIEREPITVICSDKLWLRAMKGHVDRGAEIKFKEGDRARFFIHAETTDKLIAFATNGRFYTLAGDKLPGGRGMGEPIRLAIDLENDADIVALFVHKPGRMLLVAARSGHGFQVGEDEVIAMTRKGKQVMNVETGSEAVVCMTSEGDTIAVSGDNRKVVIFPLSEVPILARGRGVTLQKYKDGHLADAKVFTLKEGLKDSNGRLWTEKELADWRGGRANAGRLAPKGFPKNNRFTPVGDF
ncbi:DNA topoisomerase 4 subunit A [Alphaproteobacteria bacterium SO-S41]|nr:DNA topoisomerase 4 subunit A [Alphaproteobacteria bacterium SO-S41]